MCTDPADLHEPCATADSEPRRSRWTPGPPGAVGYRPNGRDWATRRGEAAELNRWRLTRQRWSKRRRDDITLDGVDECLPVLGIASQADQ